MNSSVIVWDIETVPDLHASHQRRRVELRRLQPALGTVAPQPPPTSAIWYTPPVQRTNAEGALTVDLTRSPNHWGMAATCAHRTAGVDVKRLQIAAANGASGLVSGSRGATDYRHGPTRSRRWMFGRISGLDGRKSYRELRLEPFIRPQKGAGEGDMPVDAQPLRGASREAPLLLRPCASNGGIAAYMLRRETP